MDPVQKMTPFDTWQVIKPFVVHGMSDYRIARQTPFSRPTIARIRKRFHGNDAVRPSVPKKEIYDWPAIQRAVDQGVGWRELREKFGCSFRSIQKAVGRGSLKIERTISEGIANSVRRNRKPRYHPLSEEGRRRISAAMSGNNRGGRSKRFMIMGQWLQGTWERDLALKFVAWGVNWCRPKGKRAAWPYLLDGKIKHYTPDFYLPDVDKWIEVKGYWWGDDRRKMEAVMAQYPDRKILIIEKAEFVKIVAREMVPEIFVGA